MVNQPQFKSVVGDIVLVSKMAVSDDQCAGHFFAVVVTVAAVICSIGCRLFMFGVGVSVFICISLVIL